MKQPNKDAPTVQENYQAICYAILRSVLVPLPESAIPKTSRIFDNTDFGLTFISPNQGDSGTVQALVLQFFNTLDSEIFKDLRFHTCGSCEWEQQKTNVHWVAKL